MKIDISKEAFLKSDLCLVSGESDIVKISVIKEFLHMSLTNCKYVFAAGFYIGEYFTQLDNHCREDKIQVVKFRIDKNIINTFYLEDFLIVVEECKDVVKVDEVKAYLRWLYDIKTILPGESLLDIIGQVGSIQKALDFLDMLKNHNYISEQEYEDKKNSYLESMSGAIELENILCEIELIMLNNGCPSSSVHHFLYWSLFMKATRALDRKVPIIIRHNEGESLDMIFRFVSQLKGRKVLVVTDDIFNNTSERDLLVFFKLVIFSRTSYLSSANRIQEQFGDIKNVKNTYAETYDRRMGNNTWIDRIFHTNKTDVYTTTVEYEPLFKKESIIELDDKLALYWCVPTKERGVTYVTNVKDI